MPASDLTMIHLSELHFQAEGTRHLEHLDSYAEALNTLDHVRQYAPKPDFFLITGDLVLGAANAEIGYPRVRQLVDRMAAEFDVPILLALGNGDANGPFRRIVLGEVEPLRAGRYHYSKVISGLKVIVLDSHADGQHFGDFDGDQLEWLRRELAATPDMDFLLAFHHPPGKVVFGRDEEDVVNAPRLAEIIAGYNVIGILCGHFHMPYLSSFAGVPTALTSGVCSTITWSDPKQMIHERAGGGYNIVHIRDRRMLVRFMDVTSERPTLRWAETKWHEMRAARLATESSARAGDLTAPSLLDDQVAAYKRDGFIVIEDVLHGVELERVQAAFDRAQARTRVDWEEGRAKGKGVSENGEYYASGTWHARKYFDIYPLHLLEQDDTVVELIAHPKLLPFLSATVGEDVQTATIQVRVLEPQTAQDALEEGGYVNWHRDHGNDEEWRYLGRPLNTKVIVYLTDVGPDDGCTACVPGSHLWQHRPDHAAYKGMGGGENQATKNRDQRDMPGMVAAEVKAGSAFLFNTRLWHTTLPNRGSRDRWCVLTLYAPFYQKQPGVTVEAAMALEAAGQLNTPERRQLFGLEPMTGANGYKRLAQHNGDDADDRMFKGVRPPRLGLPPA